MATTTTYAQVGIREDLSDIIANVSPEETPFFSNAAKMTVDNTFFEWQTDSLAQVSADVAVEGADATLAAASPTVRVGNYTEIITKTATVSGTVESTDRAGRQKEMAYQVMKRAKELRRDAEHHLVGLNNARAAGNASTARETASYSAWCATNTDAAAADPTGDGTDAATDGTQRAFTETLLGNVIDACYLSGGNPNIIMAGAFNKRALTGFAGNADEVKSDNKDKTVINAVSLYVSDYGQLKVVPNRFVRSRDVLVYEQDYWKIGMLRPLQNFELSKTGDAENRQVLMEYGLCAMNEASSGIIRDLTDS